MGQRKHESPEIGAMVDRMLRALARRAAEGDLEAVEQLVALQGKVAAHLVDAGRGAHEFGYSWAELAAATGTSRQACSQRFSTAAKV